MSLKDQYIQQTENHINKLMEKKELLQRDLEDVEAAEKEARDMLQFFKSGNHVGNNGSTPKRQDLVTTEDFIAAIKVVGETQSRFTSTDVAEVLGGKQYSKTCTNRLRAMVNKSGNSGLVVKVVEGGPGVSAIYSLNPNYKG